VVAGLLVTAGLVIAVSWPPINAVATGRTPEYPELRPLLLRYSPPVVLARAVETVEQLHGWRLLEVVHAQAPRVALVRAEAETPVMGYVDDVTIQISALAHERTPALELLRVPTIVHVESASRVGRSDLGQNARNVQRFLGALVANLELARQVP
jgi:uncharacterized protein (DUF1499 family)